VTRKRNPVEETNERRRARHFATESPAGRGTKRVGGANGPWLAAPKPPAICSLYEDLTEIEELEAPAPIFGQYPSSFIDKVMPWLRCRPDQVLHVCSGALPRGTGIRVDIRPGARPDVVADGRSLPFRSGSVAAVMVDPPYTEHYARDLYGTSYPRPAHLLAEAARVVRPSGRILIVHYITPNPPPGCSYLKSFGLSTGMGFPMRAVTIFARHHAVLPSMEVR
jgi:hypothetical protein